MQSASDGVPTMPWTRVGTRARVPVPLTWSRICPTSGMDRQTTVHSWHLIRSSWMKEIGRIWLVPSGHWSSPSPNTAICSTGVSAPKMVTRERERMGVIRSVVHQWYNHAVCHTVVNASLWWEEIRYVDHIRYCISSILVPNLDTDTDRQNYTIH